YVTGDRPGAIAWIGTLVENICLVTGAVGDLFRVKAAEINAAVGIVAGEELDAYDEVLVRVLADEVTGVLARHLVDEDGAVLDPPVRFADLIPAVQGFAVEQSNPAGLLASGIWYRVVCDQAQNAKRDCKLGRAPRCPRHVLPPDVF